MKLEIKNIHKSFDGTEVLHGVSFYATEGSALGLLGRNGAGKTTTIRILMGVFHANDGEVLLDGKPFEPNTHKIGYMPEERGMYPKKKVLEQLIYFGQLRNVSKQEAKENALRLLDKLGIPEYANRKLETLSKGNQQKVQLVQTLINDPEIIILDEPFSGLDPVNSQMLKDLIEEEITRGKLVIFSSHQMGYVEEFCKDIVILNKGDVVLKGELRKIQKEYGDHKLILNANNMTTNDLSNLLESKLKECIRMVEVRKDFVIFEILAGYTKKEITQKVLGLDIDIDVFGDYKPTLTDIFVMKAGDE
ncbi:ABC transporter ATP-binding protein [Erysipelotrichaceae bacterium MTC7]|nr:ABC transporter ATP-binding protein [Erysipelotrichaceae bacterium MTC7]